MKLPEEVGRFVQSPGPPFPPSIAPSGRPIAIAHSSTKPLAVTTPTRLGRRRWDSGLKTEGPGALGLRRRVLGIDNQFEASPCETGQPKPRPRKISVVPPRRPGATVRPQKRRREGTGGAPYSRIVPGGRPNRLPRNQPEENSRMPLPPPLLAHRSYWRFPFAIEKRSSNTG